ncbi:MAG: sugar phosphate isomerase/epimerase [Pirellulaceae bacterium]|nr:sugar phosphate isomerase/epimerase [Pirellulaceae bacterium]
MSRRSWLASAAAACGTGLATIGAKRGEIGLGFSLYGMKSLSLAEALRVCAECGYDCVELPVMVDWPADSAKLAADARRQLRGQLADRELRLTALMENLPALGDEARHRQNLERLKLACGVARDLAPPGTGEGGVPLVETVLGGKAGDWDAVKGKLAERLGDWSAVLAEAQVKLAIKAHVGNATQQPQQLIWLLEQVASPWLAAAYDYSHFQLQDLAMTETVQALAPRTIFVHVKDTEHSQGKRGFLLPGEGTIDHGELAKSLGVAGYRGDIVVEVSGQVFSKPGYDPVAAAQKCYRYLATVLDRAGVRPS